MAMKMKVKGLDDLITAMHQLDSDTEKILASAMYDGAGMLIEAVKTEIQKLPEDPGYKKTGVERNVVTPDEKKDLLAHVGIARFAKKNGKISTAIGFDGYSSHKTRKYPNGVPLPIIARSIESGSSVRKKYPFMQKAVKAVQTQIEQTIEKQITEEIQKKVGN